VPSGFPSQTYSTETPEVHAAYGLAVGYGVIYPNSPVHWVAGFEGYERTGDGDADLCVDNKLVKISPSASLNEELSLARGPHVVLTKAWDNSGANFRSDRYITIYSGTPGETCPAATDSLNLCLPT
jgi:hypothetical protein